MASTHDEHRDQRETPSGAADEQPFAHDGGPVGVVLSHGFTGTPASMRPWADHLAAAGYTVRLPLLPGHGGTWQETNRTRWPQWYEAIEQAYTEVADRCEIVFAAGLSMGGALVTRLAEQKGDKIAGLVLVNPSLGTSNAKEKMAPYVSWLVKSRPSLGGDIKKPGVEEPANDRTPVVAGASVVKLWKVVTEELDKVTAPIRLYRSVEDHVVDDTSARLLRVGATSTSVEEILLEDSYHVATLDNDARTIFTGSVTFFADLAAELTGG
ncbi:MAG TPA: alpha/beta fold hydrolase [Jatrophihabitans sp.]